MIGKAHTGAGFAGLCRYLFAGSDGKQLGRVGWTATRNLPTDNANAVPIIMRATAAQSVRVQKPVYHLAIALPPEETLSQEVMESVVDQSLADLGLSGHQALMVAHNDTDHQHVHVMVNRVHPETGKAWCNSLDWSRIEKSLRAQEKSLGLRYVPGIHSDPELAQTMSRRPTRGDLARARRLNQKAFPLMSAEQLGKLREDMLPLFETCKSWDELSACAPTTAGVELQGKGQGLILTDGTQYAKLSQMGKGVRLKALEAKFAQSWKEFQEISLDADLDDQDLTRKLVKRRMRKRTVGLEL